MGNEARLISIILNTPGLCRKSGPSIKPVHRTFFIFVGRFDWGEKRDDFSQRVQRAQKIQGPVVKPSIFRTVVNFFNRSSRILREDILQIQYWRVFRSSHIPILPPNTWWFRVLRSRVSILFGHLQLHTHLEHETLGCSHTFAVISSRNCQLSLITHTRRVGPKGRQAIYFSALPRH